MISSLKIGFKTAASSLKLYRRNALFATAALGLLLALAFGTQAQKRKKDRGPRAIAVIQWQADPQGKAVPRLLPVAILDDGRFYDASLYRATPVPMALDPGTVYEAQDKGEILGFFTVKNPLQASTEDRRWLGLGAWQSASPKADSSFVNRKQSAVVVHGGLEPSPDVSTGDSDDRELKRKNTTVYDEQGKEIPEAGGSDKKDKDDSRPTLKRPSDPKPQSAPESKTKKGDGDPDRPTLKRGGGSQPQSSPTADTASAGSTAPKGDDDPDRPRLKRGAPTTGTGSSSASAESAAKPAGDTDPNRPVLRHGRPSAVKEAEEKTMGQPVPERVLQRGARTVVADTITSRPKGSGASLLRRMRTFEAVAVSDAGPELAESFRFKWSDDERQQLTAKMSALAQKEVDGFLRAIGRVPAPAIASRAAGGRNPRVGTNTTTPTSSKAAFEDFQIAAFDLNHNNSADLVFSGVERISDQTGALQVFVTVVARVDLEGNPRRLFTNVTSNDRLDAKPRLELVDAVDANGDGRGELLFRRLADSGSDFAIYRVGGDDVTEIFHGGAGD